jgi:hypothetical protein
LIVDEKPRNYEAQKSYLSPPYCGIGFTCYAVLYRRPTLPSEDSLINARFDSIQQVIIDSITKAETWKLGTFSDEFGDPTSKKFIKTYLSGIFSNSATSNTPLYVEVLVTKTNIGIFLHEYGASNPPQTFIGLGKVKMKNSANEIIEVNSNGDWNQNGGIKISDIDCKKFISFLNKSVGEIKVVIHDEYNSEYVFNIDVTGFKEEFKLL